MNLGDNGKLAPDRISFIRSFSSSWWLLLSLFFVMMVMRKCLANLHFLDEFFFIHRRCAFNIPGVPVSPRESP